VWGYDEALNENDKLLNEIPLKPCKEFDDPEKQRERKYQGIYTLETENFMTMLCPDLVKHENYDIKGNR